MGFLDELLTSLERVKRKFGFSWQKLLDQIPDQDRIDSYRFDEILNKWVLKSSMPEAEVPILDEFRRLQVETPNYYDFNVFRLSATVYGMEIIKLDFLCDSITIFCSKITTQHGIIKIWYWDDVNHEVIGDYIYYKTGDVDPFVEQVDTKPSNTFKVEIYYGDGVGSGSSNQVRLLFSKQKKTKISDTTYASSWNGITDIAPSKNVVYDKLVSMDSLIDSNLTATELATILGDINNPITIGKFRFTLCEKIVDCIRTTSGNDPNALLTDYAIRSYVLSLNYLTAITLATILGDINNPITIGKFRFTLCEKIVDCIRTTSTNDPNALLTDYAINLLIDALDYYTQQEVDDLIPSAGDFSHNDLDNINAGTDYEHITQTQKDALHPAVVISDVAYNEGTWDENTDGATKNAIRDKIETLGGISGNNYIMQLAVGDGGGSVGHLYGGRNMGGVGDKVTLSIHLDPLLVDTTADVVFWMIMKAQHLDGTHSMNRYAGATKTGSNEIQTPNIANYQAYTLNVDDFEPMQDSYTFANADINDDDVIFLTLNNSDASYMVCISAYAVFTHA